ncbi:hypothetical protein H6P81_006418 [Aristolochia fimbriata]|uniref:Mitochondrial succinate-fumarate transporter 1 n=1 Tax=Aristolochia fimbriata TaxID=158543 RepID=A0AAV7EYF3_ARIFI|nr:hypothetical protein H6P81_006418 [Aristolochia fimbriata]
MNLLKEKYDLKAIEFPGEERDCCERDSIQRRPRAASRISAYTWSEILPLRTTEEKRKKLLASFASLRFSFREREPPWRNRGREEISTAASAAATKMGEEKREGGGDAGPSRSVKPSIPPYMKAISGSLGGVVEACCLQPIDVIKTRLQLDRSGSYKGILHCGSTVASTEGVRALWKGLTPFATHLTLKYTLRMGSNAVFQSAFKDSKTGTISNQGRMAAGFGAGVLEALAIVTPFEVVKIRLQQQKGLSTELLKYKGPIHCAHTIIHEEGLRGLWAGAAPTVMRNGTNQAAMFTAKNAFDTILWKKHEGDGKVLQPWQSMISGFLAGTAGPVCTGPFDVVKTRLMAQSRSAGEVKYKGMIHALRTIFAEEGLVALWKGLLPRLMRIPPGQAIMWAVADQVTGLYERRYLHNAHM